MLAAAHPASTGPPLHAAAAGTDAGAGRDSYRCRVGRRGRIAGIGSLALVTVLSAGALAALAPDSAGAAGPRPAVVSFTATPRQLSHHAGSVQLKVRVRGGSRCLFAGQRQVGGALLVAKTA